MRSVRVMLGLGSSWTPGRRWCASWRAGAGLVLLCLTVYLPGFFTIPPVDRDESRFAQASRQMFESVALPPDRQRVGFHDGGLVIPKFQEKPRLNKPPMIYWMQAGAAATLTGGDPLRDAIWMYRVPSLLAAIVTVLATWRIGCGMFDARAAMLGAALLAVCPLFAWEAHQARADHVMVAATTVAMGALWKMWRRTRATDRGFGRSVDSRLSPSAPTVPPKRVTVGGTVFPALVLWLAVGIGILTKGPITPLIVLLAALALCIVTRRWSWLRRTRPVLGALVLTAMIGPWVWAVGERVGWEAYLGIVRDEVLGRSVEAREGHWGPPGYHTVLLAVLFWPGSLTTAWAMGRAWRKALGNRPSVPGLPLGSNPSPAPAVRPEGARSLPGAPRGPASKPLDGGLVSDSARRADESDAQLGGNLSNTVTSSDLPQPSRPPSGRGNSGGPRSRGAEPPLATIFRPAGRTDAPAQAPAPWSPLRFLRGMLADLRSRLPGRDAELFCLAWIVPAWIVFELVLTKLPHYTMPMYPAVALLSARAAFSLPRGAHRRLLTLGRVAWIGTGIVLILGGFPLSFVANVAGVIPMFASLIVLAGAGFDLWRGVLARSLIKGIAAASLCWIGMLGVILPNANVLWLSRQITESIARTDPAGLRQIALSDYYEDSMVFLTRGRVQRIQRLEEEAWLRAHPDGFVVLERYPTEAIHLNPDFPEVGHAAGFNYAKGDWHNLNILEFAGEP